MYRHWRQLTLVFSFIFVMSCGTPTGLHVQKIAQASASLNSDAPIYFDEGGNVGVNMAGFHASAGLGGLVDGDASKGGLHAEAGTPFGQEAGAGVKGVVDANAAAQGHAGFGFSAGAVKESTYGHKTSHGGVQVISEKTVTEAAKVVHEQTYQEAPQVHRTVIEKTVIPQYVEKTIQVPSYVEKTIRVPTVVEHKVRVPVTPKVTENTYEEGGRREEVVGVVGKHHHNHGGGFRKQVSFDAYAGSGGAVSSGIVEKPQHNYQGHKAFGFFANKHYGSGAAAAGSGGGGAQFSASGYKSGTILRDALNIPVATLGAVGSFLGSLGSSGGAGGQFSFQKQYSHYK